MAGFTLHQQHVLQTTERVGSIVSLVGTTFIFITFLLSPAFRKPINRLVFYASWGNTLMNMATLISQAGMKKGPNSVLCQTQGFLIQMFLPADAMWNLAMAINVYLTLFHKYSATRLRSLEWKYMLACYGGTFIPALVYCFIDTSRRGKVYGPASLWCWVATDWDFLRVATCYGPAWFCIITSFAIYIKAGVFIFHKRNQLRSFSSSPVDQTVMVENPFTSYKTTEIHITSELADLSHPDFSKASMKLDPNDESLSSQGYQQYTITIERGPMSPKIQMPLRSGTDRIQNLQHNVALEANAAAWGYTKCALLFFVSLLITWVPASVNRVYSLIHPDSTVFSFNYAAGLVLPLLGFWNAVIYVTTSWGACQSLFDRHIARPLSFDGGAGGSRGFRRESTISEGGSARYGSKHRASLSDSIKGLAEIEHRYIGVAE